MIYVKNQDNLVAFRKRPRLRNPPRWEMRRKHRGRDVAW